jgi:hypothetical protein
MGTQTHDELITRLRANAAAREAARPIPVRDLGTVDRDANGRYVTTYSLAYNHTDTFGRTTRVVRHLPARGVEMIGPVIVRAANRGTVDSIEVLDHHGIDATMDFTCFNDD